MKNIFGLFLVLFIFISCEKELETHLVTIYVGNAGTAGVWSHVSVTINGNTESFFTSEGHNTVIYNCDRSNSNACFFDLYPGTYNYHASDGGTNWDGTITVTENNCPILELSY